MGIIALGEGLLGTTVAIAAVIGPGGPGWSVDVVVLGPTGTVLAVAVPVAGYIASIYAVHDQLTRSFDPFHLLLLTGSAVAVATPVLLAVVGASLAWCLAVLALSPWVTVGYEAVGHRHQDRLLAGLGGETG